MHSPSAWNATIWSRCGSQPCPLRLASELPPPSANCNVTLRLIERFLSHRPFRASLRGPRPFRKQTAARQNVLHTPRRTERKLPINRPNPAPARPR